MRIKVATWNMAFWSHQLLHEEAWDYVFHSIDADLVLVQEAQTPRSLKDHPNFLWHNAGECSGRKAWGAGIYSKEYRLTQESEVSLPSWNNQTLAEMCIVANVRLSEENHITLVSLYGRIDKVGREGYSIANLHRVLSDLTGIFNGHFGKRTIILGGDLNASRQLDPIQHNNSHKIFFDRLEDFGLVDSFTANGNTGFVQTHRHCRSKQGWQNDYLFVSKHLAGKFVACSVVDNEEVRRLSDHNPVVVTLDI